MLNLIYLILWSRVHPRTIFGFFCKSIACFLATVIFKDYQENFPRNPLEITSSWLEEEFTKTGKLQPKEKITKVTIVPIGGLGFIGETVRLLMEKSNNEEESLIVKTTPQNLQQKGRMRAGTFVYFREACFYSMIQPKMNSVEESKEKMLQVPQVYLNNYAPLSGRSMLIMKDESNELQTGSEAIGASWQQCCSVAVRYANFHALHWSNSLQELNEKHNLHWLSTFDWMDGPSAIINKICFQAFQDVLEDEDLRENVPIKVQRAIIKLIRNLPKVLSYLKQTRSFTVIHADARVENMMFPKTYQAGPMDYDCNPELDVDLSYDTNSRWLALDFQTMTKCLGVYDLAYFVSLDMKADKVECDQKLVKLYHETLVKLGIRGYSLDDCWKDYQISVLISSLIPGVVMSPKSIGAEGKERGKITRIAMLKRSSSAIARVNACDVLDEILEKILGPSLPPQRRLRTCFKKEAFMEHPPPNCIDDSFSHHTPASVSKLPVSGLPGAIKKDAYDRWFLNGYSKDGEYFFAFACGFYPGRNVVDASFSLVQNGVQKNLRVSRFSTPDDFNSKDTQIGPIRVTVTKELVSGCLVVSDEEIECKLNFTARFSPTKEPKFDMSLGKMSFNYERLTQLITWDGTIITGKKRKMIQVNDWYGTRDRSWGLRPHAAADRPPKINQFISFLLSSPVGDTLAKLQKLQFYWIWVPLHFLNSKGIAFHSQEDSDGKQTNSSVKILRSASSEPSEVVACELCIEYAQGTRHMKNGVARIVLASNEVIHVKVTPLYPFFMSGVGYNSIDVPHGSKPLHGGGKPTIKRDEIFTELENRNLFTRLHIQEVCKLEIEYEQSKAKDTGVGVVEQMIVGPHNPSGFRGFYQV